MKMQRILLIILLLWVVALTAQAFIGDKVSNGEYDTAVGSAGTAAEAVQLVGSATPASEQAKGSITPTVNGIVLNILIPILVLVFGLIWKNYDKVAFERLLLRIWDIVKDTDNLFHAKDGGNITSLEPHGLTKQYGLQAAKKVFTLQKMKAEFTPEEVGKIEKRLGSLSAAVEFVMSAVKSVGYVGKIGKAFTKVFK